MVDMFIIICFLSATCLTILKAVNGKTVYDKILAANLFGSITVSMLILFGYYFNYMEVIDIALIYGLINFTAILALLKYFRYKSLGSK